MANHGHSHRVASVRKWIRPPSVAPLLFALTASISTTERPGTTANPVTVPADISAAGGLGDALPAQGPGPERIVYQTATSGTTFEVPGGVTSVSVKAWGAGGGGGGGGALTAGGEGYGGAFAGATLAVTAGEMLTVRVGGGGPGGAVGQGGGGGGYSGLFRGSAPLLIAGAGGGGGGGADSVRGGDGGAGGGNLVYWGQPTPPTIRNSSAQANSMGGDGSGLSGVTVTSVSLFLGPASQNARLAVYQGGVLDAPAGAALIWDAGPFAAGGIGWHTITHPDAGVTIAAATPIWLAWKVDGFGRVGYDAWSEASNFQQGRGSHAHTMGTDPNQGFAGSYPEGGGFGSSWITVYMTHDLPGNATAGAGGDGQGTWSSWVQMSPVVRNGGGGGGTQGAGGAGGVAYDTLLTGADPGDPGASLLGGDGGQYTGGTFTASAMNGGGRGGGPASGMSGGGGGGSGYYGGGGGGSANLDRAAGAGGGGGSSYLSGSATVTTGGIATAAGNAGDIDHTGTAGQGGGRGIAGAAGAGGSDGLVIISYTIPSYTITGTIVDGGGAPVSGAAVTATGGHTQAVTTNGDGRYVLTDVAHGATGIVVTPTLANHSFAPTSRTVNDVTANVTGQNFTATLNTYTITGTILVGSTGLPNVSVAATGGHTQTVTTDGNGVYTLTGVPHGATGIGVTPSLAGYSFAPTGRTVDHVTANVTGQDFTGTLHTYTITGTILVGGTGLPNVSVAATGGHTQTVTTDGNGVYTLTGVPHGATAVLLTPSLAGYGFTPASLTVNEVVGPVTGQDFTATLNTYTITGTILAGSTGLPSVSVAATGGHTQTVTTDGNGVYTLTGVPHGATAVLLTPSLAGYGFTPASLTVNEVVGPVTGQDFTATLNTYTITGTILAGSTGLPSVSVAATGGHTQTVTTDGNGVYALTGVPYGATAVLIVPTLAGYGFTPATRTVTDVAANVTGQDFTATLHTYTITGTILVGSTGLPNASVAATGGHTQTVTTNGDGSYVLTSVQHGATAVLLTPSLAGFVFTPATRTVNDVTANVTGQDFSAARPPGAPSITAVTPGNQQVTVGFSAPADDGGSALTNYEYSTDDGGTWTARAPASTASPLVIPGLAAGTTYAIRLRAVNAVGPGAASVAVPGTPASPSLTVAITPDDPTPAVGQTIAITVTVTNQGGGTAVGVVLNGILENQRLAPQNITVSRGAFNPSTGDWTVGDLAPGATATLTFQVAIQIPQGASR